jgi:hypothetical protein
MKFNDEDRPVLNRPESTVYAHFTQLRQQEDSVHDAAKRALSAMDSKPSKQFVEWLSDGTLSYAKGEVVEVQSADGEAAETEATETQPAK